jgi:hypothetical protein
MNTNSDSPDNTNDTSAAPGAAGTDDVRENAAWENELAALTAYVAEHGHARVPHGYVSPAGNRTGAWIATQRRKYAESRISADRIAKMESMPGWVWRGPVG